MSLFDTLVIQEYIQPPAQQSSPPIRREVFVAIRNDRPAGLLDIVVFGSGTENDPYDGSTVGRFDRIFFLFASLPGISIRLGPGVFQTRGGQGNGSSSNAWSIGSNVRIVGAGMYQSTLQLVDVIQQYNSTSGLPKVTSTPIITSTNTNGVDNVEILDLTLDCNGHRQGVFQGGRIVQSTVMVYGIDLRGSNLTFRRVRVINWGTFARKNGLECFPIIVGGAISGAANDFKNGLVEDCVVEQPCRMQARETTCINLSGGHETNTNRELVYYKNARLRNNYINGELINPVYPVHQAVTASYNSGTDRTTLRTFYPHCMRDGDWVVLTTTST